MTEIILHHYPQSPMAEKARLALGLKGLKWRSVEVPRLPPKPDLMPLTGGYRRIPVMQIGADVYCDTQCIMNELEVRAPEPSYFPESSTGIAQALGRWADDTLFNQAVHIVIATAVGTMPEEWVSDRSKLMFGADCNSADLPDDLPDLAVQMGLQIGWMNRRLEQSPYLLGEKPGLADVSLYPIVWVLRARWGDAASVFSEFEALAAWEVRMAAIGHGEVLEMNAQEALDIAHASEPQPPAASDDSGSQILEPGMKVAIRPHGPGSDPWVEGAILFVNHEKITLSHHNDRTGNLSISFPRVGYDVKIS